jgi:glycogen debranching enzyme
MGHFIKIEDEYYVAATSSYADDRTQVLNHGDTFAIFDRWGDLQPLGRQIQGLYHEGTRYLSTYELRIQGERPLLLSSSLNENNEILTIDLTNPELNLGEGKVLLPSKIHINRTKYLNNGACFESIKLANYDTDPYEFELSLSFGADFKDIFEIRGKSRMARGQVKPATVVDANQLEQEYVGLDGGIRTTRTRFSPPPAQLEPSGAVFKLRIEPKQVVQLQVKTLLDAESREFQEENIEAIVKQASRFDIMREMLPKLSSSNEQFNHWLNRSKTDLVSLIADTPWGKYPYAGIPWFNTSFGRDGLVTALQTLWLVPGLSKDVLFYLAKTQATEFNDFMDAEPGKILHEARKGEMAELGEIPYKLYYGTVDATPLFIVLAGRYFSRTNDLDTIKKIWPNLMAALKWIDEYGDLDGDGFLEYHKRSENGLIHQGWKDADDAVSHADGSLAPTPMALCEVQGYVYEAKIQLAKLANILGEDGLSQELTKEAKALKTKFNKQFWDEELRCYVIGLDADKKPCRVKSSNAGQCLFTGIADTDKAAIVAETLMEDSLFTGWGVRTLASDAARYNPMSYHNGSVWPHDNSLIAWGLSRYGHMAGVQKIFEGLFKAAIHNDMERLPELFCGFERRAGEGPTTYPVACSPQAWAVATIFVLIQSCLRVNVNALAKQIVFNRPILPAYLDNLVIENLPLGKENLSVELKRYDKSVAIHVLSKPDNWEVLEIR